MGIRHLSKQLRPAGACVALGTCLLINEAMADETSGTDESQRTARLTSMAAHEGIEEITVTATRTERPIFTTPFSVSVIDGSDIQLFQPFSYADVFEGTPGLAIQGGARRIAEEPSIRGFSDQQLVLRIDGARQNFDLAHRGRFFVDPDLVQRIEVVRGSASALYGSGALGGVISLETKGADDLLAAGDDLGGRAKLGYQGNGNEFLASGGLFGRSGKIDAFANIIYREVFDDLEDGSGETILDSRDRLLNGLLKLGITPAEHHRIEITAEVFDNDGNNPTAADDISSPSTVVDRDSTEYACAANTATPTRIIPGSISGPAPIIKASTSRKIASSTGGSINPNLKASASICTIAPASSRLEIRKSPSLMALNFSKTANRAPAMVPPGSNFPMPNAASSQAMLRLKSICLMASFPLCPASASTVLKCAPKAILPNARKPMPRRAFPSASNPPNGFICGAAGRRLFARHL